MLTGNCCRGFFAHQDCRAGSICLLQGRMRLVLLQGRDRPLSSAPALFGRLHGCVPLQQPAHMLLCRRHTIRAARRLWCVGMTYCHAGLLLAHPQSKG